MTDGGIFRRVDAVTVPVPDLDAGLRFYSRALGHRLAAESEALLRGMVRAAAGSAASCRASLQLVKCSAIRSA